LKVVRRDRRDGDAARDLGDAAIWVQLGHAQKEQGRLEDAELSYRKAIELLADDPDPHLHLGHVLKLQGRAAGALEAYRRSFALSPDYGAGPEIDALGSEVPTPARANRPKLLIAIDDLFYYLGHHTTMSGIQRVLAGTALHLVNADREAAAFCIIADAGAHDRELRIIKPGLLRRLLVYIHGDRVEREKLRSLIDECRKTAEPVSLAAADTLLVLGAFWSSGFGVRHYATLKDAGVMIGFCVYDVIPLSHPEYSDPIHIRDFSIHFAEMLSIADFIFTISEHTAASVRRFINDSGLDEIPVRAVPLARGALRDRAGGDPADDQWPARLGMLRHRPFVLYVSTIEGRKNHQYVLNVWKLLMDEGVDVPDLVFVGREGWQIAGLRQFIDATRRLDGRLHLVHDLSDGELETLYRHCMFTAFTSYVEGWGLPVGESLAHGRPCIASKTSSIPEVGGDFVDYIDPFNVRDGVASFRRMILDSAYRDGRARQIADGFSTRTWGEVAEAMLAVTAEMTANVGKSRRFPIFPPGAVFRPGALFAPLVNCAEYARLPAGLFLRDAFYDIENFGAWMRGKRQVLEFKTGLPPGEEILVRVRLVGTPWASDCDAIVQLRGADSRGGRLGEARFPIWTLVGNPVVRLVGRVQEDGACAVEFEVRGSVPPPTDSDEKRPIAIGLVSIGYARTSSLPERVEILEAV
jgi:glycosyltransferase involved in cell wall biosynthesis